MTTRMGTGLVAGTDSLEAGRKAAEQALDRMGPGEARLVIAFASPSYDFKDVITGIRQVMGAAPLIGCSSAGEFTDGEATSGAVAVTALASDTMEVRLGVGRDLKRNLREAVGGALSGFQGSSEAAMRRGHLGRTIILLTDGLAGRAEELIDELMTQTAMQYQLFGGAAGDDARFKETFVFCNDEILTGGFVCAEVLTEKPMGIGISHGWRPASRPLRVTAADGAVLRELNGRPAWELYEEYAATLGTRVSEDQASSFMMDHLLGVVSACERYKLRVPLAKAEDGSLFCAAEVPDGALVRIMEAEKTSIIQSGGKAVELAKRGCEDERIAGALVFECVATRLKLGAQFRQEVESMTQSLGAAPLMGCNSYGQLARVKGEFTGLMDATALVCLVPE